MKFQWNSIVVKVVILVAGLNLLFGTLLIALTSEELINQYESVLNKRNLSQLESIMADFETNMFQVESATYALGRTIEAYYDETKKTNQDFDVFEDKILSLFSDYLETDAAASYSLYTYLEPENENDVHDVWLTNQEQSLIRHEEIPYQRYVEKDNMSWFYDVKERNLAYWVAPYRNRYNQYISSYVIPLKHNDEFIGIIGMYLDINQIRNNLSHHNVSNDNYFWVSNQYNKIVYHPLLDEGLDTPIIFDDNYETPQFIDEPIEGHLYRHYISKTHNGWSFINTIKHDNLLASRMTVIRKVFISFLMFCFGLIAILVVASKRYANYINQMTSTLKKVQIGNYSEILPNIFNDEVGTLGHVINDTLDTISKEQRKLKQISYYNRKSSLPNLEQLKQTLQQNNNRDMVLYIMDLDNYRNINDILGKKKSDELIKEISDKLRESESLGLTLYHISGDEFAFLDLSPELYSITKHAEQILDSLRQFTFSTKYNITISGSIGIAKYPDDVHISGGLIDCANIALDYAKREGRDKYKLFSRFLSTRKNTNVSLENDFEVAIKENQFLMHYQPIFNTSNDLVSFESFVRWVHPIEGLIYPKTILHLAEQTGTLNELSNIIMTHICHDYQTFAEHHIYPSKLVVNLNHRQLLNPLFISNSLSILREEQLDPELIAFDITEDIITYDLEQTIKKLNALKVIGIDIVLDNFGRDKSSFTTLTELPIQKIKLDKSMVNNLHKEDIKSLVDGMIYAAHQLGLSVIAGCVESINELEILRSLKCDEYQGKHLQNSMDIKNCIKKIKEKSRS